MWIKIKDTIVNLEQISFVRIAPWVDDCLLYLGTDESSCNIYFNTPEEAQEALKQIEKLLQPKIIIEKENV